MSGTSAFLLAGFQVVMAMRDLFQVVFELKKQEMEKKKQRIADEQLKAKTGSSTMSRVGVQTPSGVSCRKL